MCIRACVTGFAVAKKSIVRYMDQSHNLGHTGRLPLLILVINIVHSQCTVGKIQTEQTEVLKVFMPKITSSQLLERNLVKPYKTDRTLLATQVKATLPFPLCLYHTHLLGVPSEHGVDGLDPLEQIGRDHIGRPATQQYSEHRWHSQAFHTEHLCAKSEDYRRSRLLDNLTDKLIKATC